MAFPSEGKTVTEQATGLKADEPVDQLLIERVVEAVPVTQPAFAKLLSLLDIRASREVSTACVTLGGRSRLLLNPDFIEAHCHTDESLSMLVMHELLHVLLGHTRLFDRVTPAHNFAFDALINAQLCLMFPAPANTALFRNLYDKDELPWALLRPPAGWPSDRPRWRLRGEAGRIHRALYTDSSVTTTELYKLLARLFSEMSDLSPEEAGLLGNHGEKNSEAEGADPDMTRAIREVVARWPMHERISGQDDGGGLSTEQVCVSQARREAVAILRGALWSVLDLEEGVHGVPRSELTDVPEVLPYRTIVDRRAEVLAQLGVEPLFFQGGVRRLGLVNRQRVHVYVDVSGSMADELPLIYGALLPVMEFVHPTIHLFSTRVEDIDPAAIKEGRVTSAWGTDIACVTAHLLERHIRRALVITDGWVGKIPEVHRKRLSRRRARVNSVVTVDGDTSFAAALRGWVCRLPRFN